MDKIFLIIISAIHMNIADVQAKLELSYLKPVNTWTLADAEQNPNNISMGQYGDKILIVSNSLVPDFFTRDPSAIEMRVLKNLPGAEVTVLELNGTLNLYGYAVINHGKRLRVKSGAENMVYIDEGTPLPEEMSVSRETLFTKEQMAEINDKYTKREVKSIISNAVGNTVVPMLLQRYFGNADEAKKAFNDIKLIEYK